jgi:hypothetical protein
MCPFGGFWPCTVRHRTIPGGRAERFSRSAPALIVGAFAVSSVQTSDSTRTNVFHVKHAMPRSRNLRQSTHTDAFSVVSRAAVRPSLWVSELSALLAVGQNHDLMPGLLPKLLILDSSGFRVLGHRIVPPASDTTPDVHVVSRETCGVLFSASKSAQYAGKSQRHSSGHWLPLSSCPGRS